jgi:hypothetical protein
MSNKVTITVETGDQLVTVTRQHDQHDVATLFAQCVFRVSDTFHPEVLEDLAKACEQALQARYDRAAKARSERSGGAR